MRVLRCVALLLLCLPVWAAPEADAPALQAVLSFGESHLDATSGLVKDASGALNVPESSAGYVAACLATGQNLDVARTVLGKILDTQITAGPETGHFPWQAGAAASPDATMYATPLLAYALRKHAGPLGPELAARLKLSLEAALKALAKVPAKPEDDARFLLRAAAVTTASAAVGLPVTGGEVDQWLKLVSRSGLPAGHSATFDAVKYVALKWIRECLPAERRKAVESALLLTAADLAGRVHVPANYLAGAITQAYSTDYLNATGFPSYVLYTDFGLPMLDQVEPYLAAAILPEWRAPQGISAISATTGLRRTRSRNGTVTATDTYIGSGASLGTMSGAVGPAGIPIFCTFARHGRPTMYFYCTPAPCTVQSVQADNLSLSSFNFDDIGGPGRVRASVSGVLGTRDDVKGVICYGVPWNGLPTSIGELESVAVATEECYVGLTLTRTGSPGSNEGSAAKPATLEWSGPEGAQNLLLTIYARPQEYPLPRSMNNMRAGVIMEVASQQAYPTLADFAKHLAAGRVKQGVNADKEVITEKEKPRDPNVIVPEPRARGSRSYRVLMEQTIEYTLESRSLKLTEDLLKNEALERQVDGITLAPTLLWESDAFKLDPTQGLDQALAPLLK